MIWLWWPQRCQLSWLVFNKWLFLTPCNEWLKKNLFQGGGKFPVDVAYCFFSTCCECLTEFLNYFCSCNVTYKQYFHHRFIYKNRNNVLIIQNISIIFSRLWRAFPSELFLQKSNFFIKLYLDLLRTIFFLKKIPEGSWLKYKVISVYELVFVCEGKFGLQSILYLIWI